MKGSLKALAVIVFVAVICFLFIACDNDSETDLSIQTIRWQPDGNGFRQFYTNDPQYLDWYFSTSYNVSNTESNVYEIEAKKISGRDNTSYGLLFGSDSQNWYQVLITVTGGYYVGVRIGENYTRLQDWSLSNHLRTGYNQSNRIRVTKNGSTYTIYFNNNQISSITDTFFNGNISIMGFRASISQEENFPNTPVDVRFRVISPPSLVALSYNRNPSEQSVSQY